MGKHQFDPQKYSQIFDNWDDKVFKSHRRDELFVIKAISDLKSRTIIDLGAGYGRTECSLHTFVEKIISIEIDKKMYKSLVENTKDFENVYVFQGDIAELSGILESSNFDRPLMLLLENTLGGVVGDWRDCIREIKNFSEDCRGELILSLYRKKALPGWGIKSYWYGREMNGEPDMKRTDFEKGLFVSKTNYVSKWWSDTEIENLKIMLEMKTINEIIADEYWVMHLTH